MILYSCINGSTVVDNYDESFLDTECELPTEVCDPTDDDLNAWSGFFLVRYVGQRLDLRAP